MPAKKRKLPSGKYQVSTPSEVHAKGTTKTKAEAQVRLLNAVEHGFKPTGKPAKHHSVSSGEFMDKRIKKFGAS
jgi:hypothetical protein